MADNSDVLAAIQAMSKKFDNLKQEIDELKRERSSCRGSRRSSSPSESRSRSPCRKSPSRSKRGSESRETPRRRESSDLHSWASRMEDGEENADHRRYDSEEEGDAGAADLVEISEETHRFLTATCTRSVPNETRRRIPHFNV